MCSLRKTMTIFVFKSKTSFCVKYIEKVGPLPKLSYVLLERGSAD